MSRSRKELSLYWEEEGRAGSRNIKKCKYKGCKKIICSKDKYCKEHRIKMKKEKDRAYRILLKERDPLYSSRAGKRYRDKMHEYEENREKMEGAIEKTDSILEELGIDRFQVAEWVKEINREPAVLRVENRGEMRKG